MASTDRDTAYRKICSKVTLQEKKEGFFDALAESVSKNIDIATFSKLTTDYDRIKYVIPYVWNTIAAQLIYRGKKLDCAVQKRQEGNAWFEKGDHNKALLCYCQSLIQAPVGAELVSVYSNRSALWQKMGEHALAIVDMELAVNYGAPEETRHKLYLRMAECHLAVKNSHKAKVILRLAKHFYEKYDKDNTKFLKKLDKLSEAIQKAENGGEVKSSNKKKSEDEPKFQPNKKFPSASKKLDVKFSPGVGRYAFATKNIEVGEEVLREKPYAAILSMDKMGTHCLHCLKRLRAPISCDTCANVAFCSRECKKLGEDYHKYECRVMSLLLGSGMSMNSFLALRIITQGTLENFKKLLPTLSIKPDEVVLKDGAFDTSYISIYNLGGLEDQRPPEELLTRAIMSIFLVKCIRLTGYFDINLFKNPLPTSDEVQIAALILRNLQVVQFNAYEVCEFLMDNKRGYEKSKAGSVGLAIYSTASYFNHSCAPSVTRYFIGTTMVSLAITGIPANLPIYDNYGPQFIKAKLEDRRLKLNGRYWFHCTCDACLNNWPLLQDAKDDEEGLKRKFKEGQGLFDKALQEMELGKPESAIGLVVKCISEGEKKLKTSEDDAPPAKLILMAQQALQLCHCSLGSVHYSEQK